MSIAAPARLLDFSREMRSFIGRHTDKSFDWDAFPGSRGFPELERAQMSYIGAGGSPKAVGSGEREGFPMREFGDA
jgi:hypothetical protein